MEAIKNRIDSLRKEEQKGIRLVSDLEKALEANRAALHRVQGAILHLADLQASLETEEAESKKAGKHEVPI